jgi:MoxR-like ATPase|tara:strand:+ start:4851 stop:5564 length:714 start_codon:yes stop_codon:yes gene_type:complete
MQLDCWQLINEVLGKSRRVLLYGPPGTGKTYSAVKKNTPVDLNGFLNVFQITMTEDTASANLEGFYKPSKDGGFEWHDGIAIQAWRNGGRLVINEIDHASPDAMTFLHAILDDQDIAMLTLNNDTKETVRPAEGFQVVATTNSPPESLPLALKDRFPVKIHVDKIHPKALGQFPDEWHDVINDTTLNDDPEERVSVRAWKEFFELQEKGFTVETAGRLIFGDNAEELIDAIEISQVN